MDADHLFAVAMQWFNESPGRAADWRAFDADEVEALLRRCGVKASAGLAFLDRYALFRSVWPIVVADII